MQVCVKDSMKIVEVWISNADKNDAKLSESLQDIYAEYGQKKYKVAVFESGRGDLLDSTIGLLLHNRKII